MGRQLLRRARAFGATGATLVLLAAFGCSSPAAKNTTPPSSSPGGSTPGSSTTGTGPATTTTTATTQSCALPVTHDIYDGFQIGVPAGWDVFTFDGEIIVSKDPTDTEEAVVRPALQTAGLTAASYFTSSLASMKQQITSSGGSLTASTTTTAASGLPATNLTLHAGQVTMNGQADIEKLPDETAHGSTVLVFAASWAPVSRFSADRSLLAGIGTCYEPQPATLYQIVKDQSFTYAIPPGWTRTSEGQDTIEIADGNDASASFTLTLATEAEGVDSAPTLLTWAFGQFGVRVGQVLTSVHLADQTDSNGGVVGQLYEEFTGTLSSNGEAIHGLVHVVSTTGGGVTSGVIRLGISKTALWNSLSGALAQIMGSFQHDFTQDLQEIASLSQQWQSFDQQVQGFDDALNGVDVVNDPSTGATYEAPYDAFNQSGPDGPGYYDSAGNKLSIETP